MNEAVTRMKQVFISQPMRGLSADEIVQARAAAMARIGAILGESFLVIDSILEGPENDIWYLGESIKRMAGADLVYFAPGWQRAKGCVVEFNVAGLYGLRMMVEEE